MKIRIFGIEIKPNGEIVVSCDATFPDVALNEMKEYLGKEIEHEELFEIN